VFRVRASVAQGPPQVTTVALRVVWPLADRAPADPVSQRACAPRGALAIRLAGRAFTAARCDRPV